MLKVTFISPWNYDKCNDDMLYLTNEKKGIFKNIEITKDISKAEVIIVLEKKHNLLNENILKNKKVFLFVREPNNHYYNNKNYEENMKIYNYKNFYHVFTNLSFLNKDLLYFIKLDIPKKNKILSAIVSGIKSSSLSYKIRYDFMIKLSKEKKIECDIYGHSWKNELGNSYKGELGFSNINKKSINNTSKLDGLIDYKFSICIENCKMDNYFTEKFTDAILCWTFPIYYGCRNIDKYFPKDSYFVIDINNENVFQEIIKIINQPLTQKNFQALKEARDLILYKYNIMNVVNEILFDNS